jgi:hypothetical protein
MRAPRTSVLQGREDVRSSDSKTTKRVRPKKPGTDAEAETAYRKRAATAPLVTSECAWRSFIKVAVFWPGTMDIGETSGGYGMTTRCEDMDAALKAARSDLALGFGRDPVRNRVQIIENRTRIIEVSIEGVEEGHD